MGMADPPPLPALERALRAILSPAMAGRAAALEALGADDWRVLEQRMVDHRLEPLVGWLVREDPALAARLPASLAERLASGARAEAIHALAEQHALVTTVGHLEKAGLQPMALKGACIAFTAYPEPGLRQMRDLDLLLEDEAATLAAFRTLVAQGFVRYGDDRGDPAASLHASHQLPPLVSPDGNHLVELHHRVGHGAGQDAWSGTLHARAGRLRLLDAELIVPSPEDQIVHLVRHAAVDHRFDNGPLTVSDLHFLTRSMPIDRKELAAAAARAGVARETDLLLHMAREAWENVNEHADPDMARGAAAAWALMLADPAAVRTSRIHEGLRGVPGSLTRRLLPDRARLAREQGAVETPAQHGWALVRHWGALIARRGPAFLARAAGPREDEALAAFRDWQADGAARP